MCSFYSKQYAGFVWNMWGAPNLYKSKRWLNWFCILFFFVTGMMNQKKSIVNPTMIGKGDPVTGWETTQIETDHTIGSIQHTLMITRETIMATIMTDIMDTITIKDHTMRTILMVMVMEETMEEEDRTRGGIEDKNGMMKGTTLLEMITTVLEMTTRTQEDEEQDLVVDMEIEDMHLTLIADMVAGLKGCGVGPWLVLVSPCFRKNVVATCKIGSFLCSFDNLLQKNVIVLFFGNQISKWRSFEKRAIFDLLFTFFSHQEKVTEIPSAHISLTYIHVFCSPCWLFLPY